MSLYLLLTDIHANRKAPSSCTDSYWPDLVDLLRQTVRIARKRGVVAVVWAGDVFHNKAPARTAHEVVYDLADIAQAYGRPLFITPGNHDVRNDRQDSLREQPLGVLFSTSVATPLHGWGGYDAHTQYMLYGVPWLQGYGNYREDSEVIDAAVSQAFQLWRDQVFGRGTGDRKLLVVTHAPLYPPGHELKWEYYPTQRWADAMGNAGCVFYGHVHEPHGVYTVGGVTFCNNGALSRGSLHEYNLKRQVGCTLWDDETGEFEFVPLAARPADEVFRLHEKAEVTDLQGRLDTFLNSVTETQLEFLDAGTVLARVRSLGLGPDAEALAAELLEHASHGEKK